MKLVKRRKLSDWGLIGLARAIVVIIILSLTTFALSEELQYFVDRVFKSLVDCRARGTQDFLEPFLCLQQTRDINIHTQHSENLTLFIAEKDAGRAQFLPSLVLVR